MKSLRLGGKDLRCIDTMPVGLSFDLAEAMVGSDGEGGEMRALAALSRTLRNLVIPADREALSEVLHDSVTPITFEDLNNALGELLVQYGNRPLERPSLSPRGPSVTGGVSKVVSLHRATGKAARTSARKSSKGGASRAS